MKLDNMDEPIDPNGNSIPDINLMKTMVSDEFNNFPSCASSTSSNDETRESGDGDSGGESKDNLEEFSPNAANAEESKCAKKDSGRKASKIPVRLSIRSHQPPKSPDPITVDEDVEVPILEAPEAFRGFDQDTNGGAPEEEPLQHDDDHNNASITSQSTPETGDTSHSTKIPIELNVGMCDDGNNETNKMVLVRDQCLGEQDNASGDMGHVGTSTAPISDNNNTVILTDSILTTRITSPLSFDMAQDRRQPDPADSDCFEDDGDACTCANNRLPTSCCSPSIEIGVAQCAQASGCSRVTTAKVCVALNPAQQTQHPFNSTTSCVHEENDEIHQNGDNNLVIGQNECNNNNNNEIVSENNNNNSLVNNLCWSFKNGRLVFDVVSKSADDQDANKDVEEEELDRVLYSKDLNKKIDESRSRLKYIEQKLKEAGITDDAEDDIAGSKLSVAGDQQTKASPLDEEGQEQVVDKSSTNQVTNNNNHIKEPVDYDANQNICDNIKDPKLSSSDEEDLLPEAGTKGNFCEFDVRQVETFSSFNSYWEVYDELEDDYDDDESDSSADGDDHLHQHIIPISSLTRATAGTMGIDSERVKHNPDRDNLKSLLKRPGKSKESKRNSNRVVFNENKNEFFDADYIILIREECDYDEEDDDGVCTCNQHEMVRLTCCEPNCNCGSGGYDGFEQTPQSPKFAPPLEFVDAVTLSPPEGYKDMELEEQQLLALQQMARRGAAAAAAAAAIAQQRTAVCRECSGTHEDEDDEDASQSDNEACGETNSDHDEQEKEKTDQSQQTTPTTPPNDAETPNGHRYILPSSMTSSGDRPDETRSRPPNTVPPGGSPINGILKGGKLWKQQSFDANSTKPPEPQQQQNDPSIASDDETGNRRSVRFTESEQSKRDSCDGASDNTQDDDDNDNPINNDKSGGDSSSTTPTSSSKETNMSPESTEMMLTFKLGNHVLISNNSLKPNSAVRQLFPCTKQLNGKPVEDSSESIHQYLVTAESLRAFEEAKRSKLPQIIQSGETDESIKRAIERNTLRRSLIRYEPRSKKNVQKTDNSLVERIKQLTCDVDDTSNQSEELRVSPPGEEARNSPEVINKSNIDKSFSPSSSSTTSSNSSSMSSTYKKITDLFGKRGEKDAQNNLPDAAISASMVRPPSSLPDLGNGSSHIHETLDMNNHKLINNDSRKQFLSTLAPLTACVSGGVGGSADEYYHYQIGNHVGERASMASSVGTEYSLEDIDEGLKNAVNDDESKKIAPDVLAGTPSASESGDELAMFVQQDASRIERIKKKYQPEQQQPSSNKTDDDDEHDDYGFNRRPSVRGIKPRFGSTTEILQQIQNQLQPPARVAWPYYSESGLTSSDNKSRNINQQTPPTTMMGNYQYSANNSQSDPANGRAVPYRPTSLQDENVYQNCSNQRCLRSEQLYRVTTGGNGNQIYSSATSMKISATTADYYQSLPRRNGRPLSPPPLEMSKNYHQTMVYIPYNHIEGYAPGAYYQSSDYVRVSNQNQINKRYIDPIYQQRIHPTHVDDHHYTSMMPPAMPLKPMVRIPLSRSESPVPGQFSTARATQTPSAQGNYFQPRYRPVIGPAWSGEGAYVTKQQNRHSFPATAVGRGYAPSDNASLTDSDSQHSGGGIPNGYRQSVDVGAFTSASHVDSNSPTKQPAARYLERGVPEGAAANVPSQDSTTTSSSSTMTSPTSPQNPPSSTKPMFYAMNV